MSESHPLKSYPSFVARLRESIDGDKPHIAIQEDLTFEGGLVMRGKGYLGQSVAVLVKK